MPIPPAPPVTEWVEWIRSRWNGCEQRKQLTDKEVVLDLHVFRVELNGKGKMKDGFKRTDGSLDDRGMIPENSTR